MTWGPLHLESENEQDSHYVEQLIEPDRADELVTGFERVNDEMRAEQDCRRQHGWMGKEDKRRGVGCAMIKIDLPAFAFLHAHPGALEGKVPHEVTGQPDQQSRQGNVHDHCSLSSL